MTATQQAPQGYDVFLSYDRDDAEWAEKLAAALRARKLCVWIDSRAISAGEEWVGQIEEGLRTSRVYVMIVTSQALASRWVRIEYYLALAIYNSDGLPRIVPVLVENVPLTGFLRILQCVDVNRAQSFDAVVDQLVASLDAEQDGAAGQEPELLPGPGPAPWPSPPPRPGFDPAPELPLGRAEIGYLERSIARQRRAVWEMWIIRAAAVLLGPLLYLLAPDEFSGAGPGLAMGLTLVVGFIGWAGTLLALRASAARHDRLQFLLDKLLDCQRQSDSSCARWVAEVWRLIEGGAPDPARR